MTREREKVPDSEIRCVVDISQEDRSCGSEWKVFPFVALRKSIITCLFPVLGAPGRISSA